MLLLSNFFPPKSFLALSKYPAANRPSLVLANWLVGPRACTNCIIRPLHRGHQARRQGPAHPHPLGWEGCSHLPGRQGLPKLQAPSGWSYQGSVSGRGGESLVWRCPHKPPSLPRVPHPLETRRPRRRAGLGTCRAETAPGRGTELS